MLRSCVSPFVLTGVVMALFVQTAWAQSSADIEWQTDLKTAYDLAKSARKPLVMYVFSEDQNGVVPSCHALEAGALASREFKLYRQAAIFVRINAARDDQYGNSSKFLRQSNITQVPCVTVIECWDNEMVHQNPFFGDMPTSDFLRLFRNRLVHSILSIRLHGKPVCTDTEYVRSVEAYVREYAQLRDEFVVANRARKDLLNQLRVDAGFRIDALKAADQVRVEIVLRMVARLVSFSELNSPEVLEFCSIQMESLDDVSTRAILLEEQLLPLTVDGQFPGAFTVTLAQLAINTSERQAEQELVKYTVAAENAGVKIDQRYNSLVRQDSARAMK